MRRYRGVSVDDFCIYVGRGVRFSFKEEFFSLNQINLYIAIRSKKSFFGLKKFLDYFFFFELKK